MGNMFVKPNAFGDPRVMYLVINDRILITNRENFVVKASDGFYNMVHEEVMQHVIDGKEPPEQIRTAVLNLADDMMAGNEVTLRAGDYIALMNHARERKLL